MFLTTNESITCSQAAFCKLYPTITSLISSKRIFIDGSNVSFISFLDLKKDVDTVDHDVLSRNLYACGISGKACNWFESYINLRMQFSSLNGQHSKP